MYGCKHVSCTNLKVACLSSSLTTPAHHGGRHLDYIYIRPPSRLYIYIYISIYIYIYIYVNLY